MGGFLVHTYTAGMPRGPQNRVENADSGVRKGRFSAATKQQLVAVARKLFTKQGYASTSLDEIVAGADVTKGALYHHFTGKAAVFEAVFNQVENDAAEKISLALRGHEDPWDTAVVALRTFLEVVCEPAYQRIVVQEGAMVLGFERFRAPEERTTYGLVGAIVRSVLDGTVYVEDDDLTDTLTGMLFGALSAAGEAVNRTDDPAQAAARVDAAVAIVITGLRTFADQGRLEALRITGK